MTEIDSTQKCPNCKKPVERYLGAYGRCPNCNIILSSEKGKTLQEPLKKSETQQHTFEPQDSLETQVHKMKNKLRIAGVLILLAGIPLLLTLNLLSCVGILLIITGLYFIAG